MNFNVKKETKQVTLSISGELDALSVPQLRPSLETLVEEAHPYIAVDLRDLRVIDSSGVGAIVYLLRRARTYGGRVVVVGACDQPLAIFKLLKLDSLLFGHHAPG